MRRLSNNSVDGVILKLCIIVLLLQVRMDQRWRGVKIYGARMLAEQENTGLFLEDSLDGTFYSNIEESLNNTEASVSESKAIRLALKHNGHRRRQIQNVRSIAWSLICIFIHKILLLKLLLS